MYAKLKMKLENTEVSFWQSSNLQGIIMENIDTSYAEKLHGNQLNPYSQYITKENGSYVIFICTFDALGKGESVYTFENMCKEIEGLPLGDETHKIFLNARGASKNVSAELQAFLQYVAGNKNDNAFVQKLDDAVVKAKKNEEWRREYMTLLMRDRENIEKGRQEGRIEGYTASIRLCQRFGMSKTATLEELKREFSLSDIDAKEVLEKYWKE